MEIIFIFYRMQTNIWNLRNSKQRIGIREKTEAHKRHLISLTKAKSNLDDQNQQWKTRSLNSSFMKKQKKTIIRRNEELVNRIMNVEKLKNSRSRSASSGRKFISVAENLRNVSTKSRECKKRKIEEENNKFFNRLVNTSSTMSKVFWMRNIRDIQNYKQNLIKTKYNNPDYNKEVARISEKGKKATYSHLKIEKYRKQFPELSGRAVK